MQLPTVKNPSARWQVLYFVISLFLLSGFSLAHAAAVTYTYSGPAFDTTTSEVPALYDGLSISGSFTTEALAPSGWTDLSASLPSFNFFDGIRAISNGNIVLPGDVTSPAEFYVQSFTVKADALGDIEAWSIWFISSSLTNALRTTLNGTGSDATRITQTVSGCTNAPYCLGSINTSAAGTSGTWTSSAAAVPAPAAFWLFISSLLGLYTARRR